MLRRLSRNRPQRRLPGLLVDIGLLIILALLPLAFFSQLLVGDQGGIWTISRGDFDELHLPYRVFFAREVAAGVLPLWNPYVAAGHSALGDLQYGIFYPVSWLFALLAGEGYSADWLEAQIIFHFCLSAIFTYLFARSEVGSRLGSFAAAIIFTFGGYLTTFPVTQLVVLQVSTWLPLALLTARLAASHRSPALAIGTGLILAVATTGGHPQTIFYIYLLTAAYLVASCASRGSWQLGIGLSAVTLASAFAVSAPQLLPAFRQLSLTDRTDVNYEFLSAGFRPAELAGLFFSPLAGGDTLYHGLATLALVGLTLTFRRQPVLARFWAVVAAVALIDSLGGSTFMQGFLSLVTPLFKFRQHERATLFVAIALAILAGHAVAYLSTKRVERKTWAGVAYALFGIAGLSLAIGIAAILSSKGSGLAGEAFMAALFAALAGIAAIQAGMGIIPRQAAVLALILILGLDLFTHNWERDRLRTDEPYYPASNRVVSFLDSALSEYEAPYRVATEGLLIGDGNAGALWQLPDIVGNSPLETRVFRSMTEDLPELIYWRLWAVRYIVTERSLDHPAVDKLFDLDGHEIYELDEEWRNEPAWFADRINFAPSDRRAIGILKESDPKQRVVIHERVEQPAQPAENWGITWLPSSVNERNLLVYTEVDSWLVVSQSYHPDWRAYVDGAPADLARVNLGLTGLIVPAGAHAVSMRYESPDLPIGILIASVDGALALTVIVGELIVRHRWRRRSRTPGE